MQVALKIHAGAAGGVGDGAGEGAEEENTGVLGADPSIIIQAECCA